MGVIPDAAVGAWSEGYAQGKKDGMWMNKETPNPYIGDILRSAGIAPVDIQTATTAVQRIAEPAK